MILDEHKQGSCLYSTLYGFRSSIIRNFSEDPFNIISLPFIATNDHKQELRSILLSSEQADIDIYPYVYAKITQVEIIKEQNTIKNLAREGYIGRGSGNITDRSVKRGFLFPAALTCEFHYIDTDIERSLMFIEQFLLAISVSNLSFTIIYDSAFEWVGNVSADSIVSIDEAVMDDPSSPAEIDVNLQLRIDTKLGFAKAAYKVNERAPDVDIQAVRSEVLAQMQNNPRLS